MEKMKKRERENGEMGGGTKKGKEEEMTFNFS